MLHKFHTSQEKHAWIPRQGLVRVSWAPLFLTLSSSRHRHLTLGFENYTTKNMFHQTFKQSDLKPAFIILVNFGLGYLLLIDLNPVTGSNGTS